MLVCPDCRGANPEGTIVCEHCGAEMKASSALRARRTAPVDVDIPPRKQVARWVPITTFAAIVAAAAALAVWFAVRPQACDGKYSSSQFAYCLTVPRGWTISTATIGSLRVDQFVHGGSTAVVMSVPLRTGATAATYAALARTQTAQAGLQSGSVQSVRLGGRPAYEWSVSDLGQTSFRGLEIVSVVDGNGWTVQLDDDVSTYATDAARFRSMLSSWHFR